MVDRAKRKSSADTWVWLLTVVCVCLVGCGPPDSPLGYEKYELGSTAINTDSSHVLAGAEYDTLGYFTLTASVSAFYLTCDSLNYPVSALKLRTASGTWLEADSVKIAPDTIAKILDKDDSSMMVAFERGRLLRIEKWFGVPFGQGNVEILKGSGLLPLILQMPLPNCLTDSTRRTVEDTLFKEPAPTGWPTACGGFQY